MVFIGMIFYIRSKKLRDQARGGEEEMELPTFSITTIVKATDNFSSDNRLGEGGFGTVYKMIAGAIVIGVIIHAGVHISCDFPRLVYSSPEKFALIGSNFHGERPTFMELMTCVEVVTGISMVVLMAIAFTLATSYFRKNVFKLPAPLNKMTGFNVFWYSHHLFGIVYVLLIVHGTFLFLTHKWNQKTVSILYSDHTAFLSVSNCEILISETFKSADMLRLRRGFDYCSLFRIF